MTKSGGIINPAHLQVIKSFFTDDIDSLYNALIEMKTAKFALDVVAERGIAANGPPYAFGEDM